MAKLFTIGFTEKTAEKFFTLLKNAGVKKIIDIRLNNVSQLAGFAKGTDLEYFAKEIADISYEHVTDFAPTKELLNSIRGKEISWQEYEVKFLQLLKNRKAEQKVDIKKLHNSCLLCSEHAPDNCHRKLVAEYLHSFNKDIEIIHLK
jgi:uncharacterized protein (DUF488 family)